jgi:hypothetical protein
MKALRALAADGFELLGEVTLGGTVVVGDPTRFLAAPEAGAWFGGPVLAGRWFVVGRPFEADPDRFDELVLVHELGVERFWALYDAAIEVATCPVDHGQVLVVDGGARLDHGLLREVAEVDTDALPWVLDRGVLVASVGHHPAVVRVPRAREILLVSVGLGPVPDHVVPVDPFAMDSDPIDDA